jgi:hypothetical protein
MDGPKDVGRTDGLTDRWTKRLMDGQIGQQTDRETSGNIDRWAYREQQGKAYILTHMQIDKQMDSTQAER